MKVKFRDKWEPYLIAVVNKDIGGFKAAALRAAFRVLSYVYGGVVRLRVVLYRHKILRSKSFGCLVISVGNLTVGGTGKTPVVEMIARRLIEGGRRVAILSRGYRSKKIKNEKQKTKEKEEFPRVVSDGVNVLMEAEYAGDEPYMLAKDLPRAVVLVDKNRVRAARYAIKKFKADTILLDDGYQYLRLNRQVNIVLIDCTNPFGRHRLLPRGILREPVKNLDRANIFILTKTKGMDLYALKRKLNAVNDKADIIQTTHTPKYLNDIYSGTKKDLLWLAGKRIACVSGIASPGGFEKLLGDLGAVVVSSHRFPDHHSYTEEEIREVIKCAQTQNAQALLTTEKDAVRFPKIDVQRDFPLYYLRVEIEILSGAKEFYDKIGRMCY